MPVSAKVTHDLPSFAQRVERGLDRGSLTAVTRMAERAKLKLRADTLSGGFNQRLANTWRSTTYKDTPAGRVWSKAPMIMQAFAANTVILPKRGMFLAIPTENVPRSRQGRPLSVQATMDRYGKELVFIQPGGFHGGISVAHGGVAYMVLRQLHIRKSSGRFRNASAREIKRGGGVFDVVMFVLVRQVHLRKRLDWPNIFRQLKADWRDVLASDVDRELEAA